MPRAIPPSLSPLGADASPGLGQRFASAAVRATLRRRAAELAGLAFGLAGLALALALLSHDPADPSLSTATAAAPGNLAGPAGAVASDALLQGFGLAAALPALCLLAWAWRLATQRGLSLLPLRLAALLLALPLAGACLALAAEAGLLPAAAPTLAGPGGVVGPVAAGLAVGGLRDVFGPFGTTLGHAVLAVAALACAFVAMALTGGEWRRASRAAVAAPARLADASRTLLDRGASAPGRRPGARAAATPGPLRRAGAAVLGVLAAPLAAARTRLAARRAAVPAPPGREAGIGLLLERADDRAARRAAVPEPRGEVGGSPGDGPAEASAETVAGAGAGAAAPPVRTGGARVRMAEAPPDAPDDLAVPRPPAARVPPAPVAPAVPAAAGPWRLPPLDLLKEAPVRRGAPGVSEEVLQATARALEGVLDDYGVRGRIAEIRPGPVVTLYELEPAPGTRSARVIGLADDIARSMSVTAVRIATVPGRNVVGIELPNARRETVYLRELFTGEAWARHPGRLNLALGKDIGGAPVVADLTAMPHLLIAGTTGSGKSVAINTMILSLLYRLSPDECRFIMIDPKMLELSVYDRIPHLLAPVVTESPKAIGALKWAVREMERRYRAMSQLGVRNIGGYNEKVRGARIGGEQVVRRVQTGFDPETGSPVFEDRVLALEPLPLIVVVIDEMADLMVVAGKEIEASVQRLAQMARAAGIHVVMATQRPSVDVITGIIKANFPTRISFQVSSKIDSRTILGEQGAEQLLGQGDMLHMAGVGRMARVHGPFVSDEEVERVVEYLRAQGEPAYVEAVTEAAEEDEAAGGAAAAGGDGEANLYDQAVALVTRDGRASTSYVQRCLNIGYNRAAKLIEQMEREGVLGPANHVGRREVLTRRDDA